MHPDPTARIGVEDIEDRFALQEDEPRGMLAIGSFEKLQRPLLARREKSCGLMFPATITSENENCIPLVHQV